MASDDIETQRQHQHLRYVVTAKLHNACLEAKQASLSWLTGYFTVRLESLTYE